MRRFIGRTLQAIVLLPIAPFYFIHETAVCIADAMLWIVGKRWTVLFTHAALQIERRFLKNKVQ